MEMRREILVDNVDNNNDPICFLVLQVEFLLDNTEHRRSLRKDMTNPYTVNDPLRSVNAIFVLFIDIPNSNAINVPRQR